MLSHHAVLTRVEKPLEYVPNISPHVTFRESKIGIDLVRSLIESAHRRPSGEYSELIILVATEFITEEAQQALLKITEEPPVSTKFIFVVPKGCNLLPTLESRFEAHIVSETEEDMVEFESFLNASYGERMTMIETVLKKKDTKWQAAVKRGLVQYLKHKKKDISAEALRDLEYVARTLLTRGASNKFLFEQAALSLPT